MSISFLVTLYIIKFNLKELEYAVEYWVELIGNVFPGKIQQNFRLIHTKPHDQLDNYQILRTILHHSASYSKRFGTLVFVKRLLIGVSN